MNLNLINYYCQKFLFNTNTYFSITTIKVGVKTLFEDSVFHQKKGHVVNIFLEQPNSLARQKYIIDYLKTIFITGDISCDMAYSIISGINNNHNINMIQKIKIMYITCDKSMLL